MWGRRGGCAPAPQPKQGRNCGAGSGWGWPCPSGSPCPAQAEHLDTSSCIASGCRAPCPRQTPTRGKQKCRGFGENLIWIEGKDRSRGVGPSFPLHLVESLRSALPCKWAQNIATRDWKIYSSSHSTHTLPLVHRNHQFRYLGVTQHSMNLLKRSSDQHMCIIHRDLLTQCSDKCVLSSFVMSLVFRFS